MSGPRQPAKAVTYSTTLNTIGCRVYYQTLTNNGTVDDLANLIEVVQLPGDCNGDGGVDLDDHASLEACLAGPDNGLGPGCGCFDFDSDGDTDLVDFAEFQVLFPGL